jgi:quercetin dioxygenase-like cupin family protein
MEVIELKPAFVDERGSITDLIGDDTINAVTVITFTKGAVRGNHYHEHTIQWNYVMSGEVLLVTQMPGGERQERLLKKGEFAYSREQERHALRAETDAEVLILTKGPRAGFDYEKDTYRLVDEPLIARS